MARLVLISRHLDEQEMNRRVCQTARSLGKDNVQNISD
jgi:hypothetical protein